MEKDGQFLEAYRRLNEEQKRAVDHIEGPVFVIAGPGTGKTQVLTLRIANILRLTDTPPEAILALTFTEAAAREMRERLAKIIGTRARSVRIHTFHGFAESIISRFPDEFPRIIGSHIATDAERAEILDAILLSAPVKYLRPFGDPLYYHPHVARAIGVMKREKVTPSDLEQRIKDANESFTAIEGKVHDKGKYAGQMKGEFLTLQKKIEKTQDLLVVYQLYEDALKAARRYDYDDLILEAVRALEENVNFKLQVQESLLYVLADEHQDANRAQNALLELLSSFHDSPNIFIVGDEKQAIYRFQGADLDNVHYFREKFTGTEVIALVENYRSTQTILDSALSLIVASPDERLSRAPLIARSDSPSAPLTLTVCSSEDEEMAQLAENIHNSLEKGILPGDIAVLVRRNKDVASVSTALIRHGILVTGVVQDNALENRFVQSLLRLLAAAVDPVDSTLSGILSLPGFPLAPSDIARLTQFARAERRAILSVLTDDESLSNARLHDPDAARALGHMINELHSLASFERPVEVATRALQLSGLLPKALSAGDRSGALASIRGLLLAFEDISTREHGALLPRALALLTLYEERGIPLPGKGGEDSTRVKVMTVHRAKGREFVHVFLPILTSSAWSTRSRPEHFYLPDILSGSSEQEDERRLFYVAITRAKEHVTLSYSLTGLDDRTQDPSDLLEDVDPSLISLSPPTASVSSWLEVSAITQSSNIPTEDDLQTLRAAFFAQGLSPTAFNNYLECPWKYFYVNLLRLPEAENKFMLLGTAIHAALKHYADARAKDTDIGPQGLIDHFNRRLARLPLTELEIQELESKGKRALSGWWESRHDSWPTQTQTEQRVEAEIMLSNGEILRLRGALDRIDEVASGFDVVDYKTGKPKSRNELMGATKDANGNYYRQLTFYKLLLQKGEQPRQMREGIIEFVEPDEKGAIRTERFEITEGEVDELEEKIRTSSEEILTLSFWNDPCDEKDCEWCALRFNAG